MRLLTDPIDSARPRLFHRALWSRWDNWLILPLWLTLLLLQMQPKTAHADSAQEAYIEPLPVSQATEIQPKAVAKQESGSLRSKPVHGMLIGGIITSTIGLVVMIPGALFFSMSDVATGRKSSDADVGAIIGTPLLIGAGLHIAIGVPMLGVGAYRSSH